jgi:translation elongation factor EF-1beta
MKDLIDLAIDIIENSFGIKAIELVMELSKSNYSLDEITAVLEELETGDKVSVLNYLIPNKTSSEKIIFFPKGTKILTFT